MTLSCYSAERLVSDPILDPMSPQIACNDDGTSGALQLTATVKAGDPITAYWNQVWPHPFGPMVSFFPTAKLLANSLEVDLFGSMPRNDLHWRERWHSQVGT
jgi:hypothetical protein